MNIKPIVKNEIVEDDLDIETDDQKHTVDTFDPYKASDGNAPYKIGMYDAVIHQTDEEMTEWANENTAYKYKIYRYDIDIALEYIFICSKNKKNRAREILIKRYAEQEGMSEAKAEEELKNTTSRKGLMGFYKYISENHNINEKKINLCDRKKATALLDLVVELGMADCIDDTFDRGRARKFRLSGDVSQVRENWNTKRTIGEIKNCSGLIMVA